MRIGRLFLCPPDDGRFGREGTIIAISLPNGSTISIGDLGSPVTVSALSNANPGVATATAHGLSDGDIVVISSGWSRLDGRVARVDNSDTGTFALEGMNTTDTDRYPAGSGTGSVTEVTAWTQISQVLSSTTDGGEQQFATYSFLEDGNERRIPTTKSARGMTITLGDDQSLAWFAKLVAADDDRLPRPIRIQLPSGAVIYENAYVTINKTPTLNQNEVMGLTATLSFVAEAVRYAAAS